MSNLESTKQIDIGRKYVIPKEKYDIFKCKFCDKLTNGGVKRIKDQLAGDSKNVTACLHVHKDVRIEVIASMKKKKEAKATTQMMPLFLVYNDYDEEVEVDIQPSQACGQPSLRKCKDPMDRFVCLTPQDVLKGINDKKQNFGVCDKELRDKACSTLARWFYDVAIPFNATTYESFKEALELVEKYGFGFKQPSMYELRVPLLKKKLQENQNQLAEHKK